MERKSNRMVQRASLLVVTLLALYGTHAWASANQPVAGNTAEGKAVEYWWAEANKRLGLRGGAKVASALPSARVPYWWESSPEEQNRPCRYGWDNPENSPREPVLYWWHTPTAQGVGAST